MSQSTAAAPKQLDSANKDFRVLCLAVIPKSPYNSFPLYWIRFSSSANINENKLVEALAEILSDPLQELLWSTEPNERTAWIKNWLNEGYRFWAECQFLPGVTDNLSHTVQEALSLKGIKEVQVASGNGYLFGDTKYAGHNSETEKFSDAAGVEAHAKYKLFHPLMNKFQVHDLSNKSNQSNLLTFPAVHLPKPPAVAEVDLNVSDDELLKISKDRLLALTLEEMQAVRNHFLNDSIQSERKKHGLPTAPTDVELEVIAQTWSEHCKHKIFNATINHVTTKTGKPRQQTQIKSLYKTFIQAATRKLMPVRTDLLSVFEDNSGVVRWNDKWAICFKVETHNSPSALEPYGGALTGILGVNRDVLGTGLGAKPIFNTDVFCFAYPSKDLPDRPKLLPAKTILDGVRQGVQDGGNKSGIPTVNGAIYFDPGYRAKPLVYCGTGGLLPIKINGEDAYVKHTKVGDAVVMVGGRVGKDGVHGATFSSETLHEGSPVSAVQIGDPFTQKRMLDFILEARDQGLLTGITDNGAGGLSSSVGEMARITGGATMELDRIPTKYPGLADWEIVVSESQERMTISTKNVAAVEKLAKIHSVEITEIGKFTNSGHFEITHGGKLVAFLQLEFLHEGVPNLQLDSEWIEPQDANEIGKEPNDFAAVLLKLLSHPNISSREQVIRQYDHEVQAMSVIKPLMGPKQQAPCDAAVIAPLYNEEAGLSVSNGLCPRLSEHDPYLMATSAVDEAVRNAVCVGTDPKTISLLDNFCWPDPVFTQKNKAGKKILGQLVRACEGLYDAVIAFGAPLISGKDSMKNDFDDGVVRLCIPPTLLISAIGKLPSSERAVSMEFKQSGDLIYILSAATTGLAASHYEEIQKWKTSLLPSFDPNQAKELYAKVFEAISHSWVKSAHDVSEGGVAVCLAESAIGSGLGAAIEGEQLQQAFSQDEKQYSKSGTNRIDIALFGEGPGKIIVSIDPKKKSEWEKHWQGFNCVCIGSVTTNGHLKVSCSGKTVIDLSIADLERAWKTQLPFG